jgi:hypothetical protein
MKFYKVTYNGVHHTFVPEFALASVFEELQR